MVDFKIRSSQKDTSMFGWLKIRYSTEYDNNLWKKVLGDADKATQINTQGISSLERNACRIVQSGLFCRSRFEEAYEWCREHRIVKVKMCTDDIEFPIAVCRGVRNFNDGSDEMREICEEVRKESRKRFVDGLMYCGLMHIYKDIYENRFLRCWYEKRGARYDECQGYMLEMATRFDLVFEFNENVRNGDRIFTFKEQK